MYFCCSCCSTLLGGRAGCISLSGDRRRVGKVARVKFRASV